MNLQTTLLLLLSGQGARFTHADLTNVGLWWDSSALSTLWQDTAGTSPVTTDGQSVARQDDKSGNGRNQTQATGSAQASAQLAEVNGNAALQYATDDFMAVNLANGLIANGDFTLFCTLRFTGTTAQSVYSEASTATTTPFVTLRVNRFATGQILYEHRTDAGGGAFDLLQYDGDYNDGNSHNVCITRSGNDFTMHIDGVLRSSQTSALGATTVTRIGTGALVFNTPSNFYNGFLCEIIITDDAKSSGVRSQVESYLTTKWF